MGEVCQAMLSSRGRRRRSMSPSYLTHSTDDVRGSVTVDWSTTTTKKKTSKKKKKTRWSLGGGAGNVSRCGDDDADVATASCSRQEEGPRKRGAYPAASDLPSKRRSAPVPLDGGMAAGVSSSWNCVGLTWSGLRRRLGVFRRSCRLTPHRRHHQPAAAAAVHAVHAGISVSQLYSVVIALRFSW